MRARIVRAPSLREAIEREIDDRRRVQREELRQREAADDRDAERPTQLRPGAAADGQGQPAEQRGHRRHEDRPEAHVARLKIA